MNKLEQTRQATELLDAKAISFQDWAARVLGEDYRDVYSDEYLRRAARIFSIFINNAVNDADVDVDDKDVEILRQLREARAGLEKERLKIRTENLEYAANRREVARHDMLNEEIIAAINRLEPIKFSRKFEPVTIREQVGVLCIGDEHYGTIIDMESLFGEKVNVYNPDVFKARMEKLMNDIENDFYSVSSFSRLVVFDLGDSIQGIIHMSDLMKLKAGIVDCSMEYAEYISQWLVELSERLQVPIEYIAVGGNHSQIRSLNTKKGDLPEDNIAKIITQIVRLRLDNNPNIEVAPYAECGFKTIQGVNILAYHGDDTKDVVREIAFFEDYHQIDINILLLGHFHHLEQHSVGIGLNTEKEVIKCPSIVGVDDYSKRCRKLSRAGALLMLFEDEQKTWVKKYILN
nr:MAG TPA: DNA polymerase II small subunit [Caudoviricetes sp.]